MTAEEAAARLGIRRATLYSYASRGLLRRVPGRGPRPSRYRRDDVERLRARSRARRGHTAAAADALRWGAPVLDSAVSEITPAGPVYRDHPALALVRRGASFEQVAELLWTGVLPEDAPRWPLPPPRKVPARGPDAPVVLDLALLVGHLGARDPRRLGALDPAEHARARDLLQHMARRLGPGRVGPRTRGVAGAAAAALGVRGRAGRELIEVAMILLADHELNASTFAARVVASTGADLYACVAGALHALSGPRHGGACDRIEALVDSLPDAGAVEAAVGERLARAEGIPGFAHPLYPDGDPRAAPLLRRVRALRLPRAARADLDKLEALAAAMAARGHGGPAVDAALVMACRALRLPPGTPTALFALGRAAGWVAHVLEQRARPYLLRPRARYVAP